VLKSLTSSEVLATKAAVFDSAALESYSSWKLGGCALVTSPKLSSEFGFDLPRLRQAPNLLKLASRASAT